MKPGKKLEGAPRKKRQKKERKPGPARASLVALVTLCTLLLVGVGGFALAMHRQLGEGLLAQAEQARRRPDWVPLSSLPRYVPEAFLAVVDTTSFRREALQAPEDGTPRLAHDLVRQVHQLDGGLGGEARELAMTPLLESSLSHRELLELYLNRIYLGKAGGWDVYGIGHAAREYFGKEPQRLTPSEAATLAGILLAPRLADPARDPGRVGPRRNEVLRTMHERGVIDAATYRAAVAEPLAFQPGTDYAPMSRPLGWKAAPDTIRLPPAAADTVTAPRDSATAAAVPTPGGALPNPPQSP